MKQKSKDKIKEILEGNPEGLTVNEIAKLVNMTRQTVATKLAEFRGAKLIHERLIGATKLIFWVGEK